MLIIAIDFDGTIVEHRMPKIGYLKDHAKEVINNMYKAGHQIIIWTCRYLPEHIEAMKKFLDSNGILYHKVNENSDLCEYKCTPKIYADVYIDDRGLGGLPDDWLKIYNRLKNQFPNEILVLVKK